MDKKADCIVIGGGFAGIAAATELARYGKSVFLLEARPYLGGRARSFVDKETGEVIDNGQHLLMGCYTHTLALLQTLGTRELLAAQPRMRVDFVDADGSRHPFDTSRLPGKAGTALGLVLLSGLSVAEKLQAVKFALLVERNLVQPGTSTVEEFLHRYKQSPRSIERFWEPIVLATLNAHPREASAFLLAEVLRRAFFADVRSSQLLFPAAGLSELLAPFPQWLQAHRGTIHHVTAEALLTEGNRVVGITTETGTLYADTVISCIPARALSRLLTEKPLSVEPVPDMQYSPIVSVYLWFDKAFLQERFFAMLGTTIQWIFNRRLLCTAPDTIRAQYPGHIALTISAADAIVNESAETIVQRCMEELHRAFPASREATLLSWQVIKEKMATIRATPDINSKRPNAATSLDNLFLAGDWTNTKLPATIEGACQSGVMAARQALHQ